MGNDQGDRARSKQLCLVMATLAAGSCGGGSTGGAAPEVPGLSADGEGGQIFFEPRANARATPVTLLPTPISSISATSTCPAALWSQGC